MKEIYKTIFKQHFRYSLLQMRNEKNLTQSQMAEKLNISGRAYADLESGKSCCSTITFILFLNLCDDYSDFIKDINKSFEEIYAVVP
ncbi:MAG: helix-turn-helix transcriptional regulator [Ruminococcus sp.]|nr:helix-turn-helix transcriptional regulator [Ruminococcus sp.]